MPFFQFIDLKYTQLNTQVNNYLSAVYNRASEVYSNASPFGQILNMLKNFYQQLVSYQKNVVTNQNIDSAGSEKAVRNLARIAGLNPTRAISATGTIILKLKPNINIAQQIGGGSIVITDKTKIKNNTNGLTYTIKLGTPTQVFTVSQSADIYLNIIEGTYETQSYTGIGEMNQTLSVNVPVSNTIDNFEVTVSYNNQVLTNRDNVYDMSYGELACIQRTGMNGGVDIIFGNSSFGFIPLLGTTIAVTYLLTSGTKGIILTPQINDFQFTDTVVDMNGQDITVTNLFDITVQDTVNFASDGESIAFTKSVMPFMSRNFVLATPDQYIFALKRLSMFSQINVYTSLSDTNMENDNKVFLFLIPMISNFFSGSVNYFNVPISAFSLSATEQSKVITYLRKVGNIPINTVISIIQLILSYYVMNIYVRIYSGYLQDTITQGIITNVSNYLASIERDDRIPKSEVLSQIQSVSGVDSANMSFVSKKNEDYLKLNQGSTNLLGLDPVLGDAMANPNELLVIRGGWSDSNYIYYNETFNGNQLGPINIYYVGVTDVNSNNS